MADDRVRVFWHGHADEVEVPEAGEVVKRGKSIEVDADMAERMLAGDAWSKSPKKSADEKAAEAAAEGDE